MMLFQFYCLYMFVFLSLFMLFLMFIVFFFFFFLFSSFFLFFFFFFFSSRRRHTRYIGDWSSDVCSSDLVRELPQRVPELLRVIDRPAVEGRIVVQSELPVADRLAREARKVRFLDALEIGRASCRERV